MAINLGDLVVSTLRKYSKQIADNVTNHNAVLSRLKEKNQIRKTNDGRTIAEPLIYGSNSSVKWYTGYDTFTPPTTQEILDAAEYEWKQLGGFISISGREKVQNRGESRQFEFARARTMQLMAQLNNTVGTAIYANGTGSGGLELGGLQLLVADNPAAIGTVGGIDQVANVFWRNYFSPAVATDETNIKSRMNAAWLALVRGKDHPDLITADDDMYTDYWTSLQEQARFTSSKMADAGFDTLRYKGADVVFDDQCPDQHMYFLNTDFLFLRAAPDRIFEVGDKRVITNADYEVVPTWFMGAMTTSNRSLQGVVIGL